MATVYLSPIGNGAQFFTTGGLPLNAGLLNTYIAGTTTPQATYTSPSGLISNPNPIVLGADGRTTQEIWLTQGVSYKFILTDSLANILGTYDNLSGINDPTSNSLASEWLPVLAVPTFVNMTQFTMPNNQTLLFATNRRVQVFVSAGILYGTVVTSVFNANVTTVTVSLDSGVLDTGLTQVNVGILNSINSSIPPQFPASDAINILKNSADVTKIAKFNLANISTGNIRILTLQDKNVTVADLLDTTQKLQSIASSVAANALTVNYNGGVLDFRSPTATVGTPTTIIVGSNSIVVPSTATLGTVSGVQARLALLEVNNGGLNVACIVNLAGGLQLDETNLISPTTISTGATSASVIYSNVAVGANIAYRVVGYIDITEATAGTWATAPTAVQGFGGQAFSAFSSFGFGQTWQNVTGSRVSGTTYYNTSGKLRKIKIVNTSTGANAGSLTPTVNGVLLPAVSYNAPGAGYSTPLDVEIPSGQSYSVAAANFPITSWFEF